MNWSRVALLVVSCGGSCRAGLPADYSHISWRHDLYTGYVDDPHLDILCAFSGQVDPFVVRKADGGLEFAEGDIGAVFFVEAPADAAADAFPSQGIAFGLVEIVTPDDEAGFGGFGGEFHGRAEGDGRARLAGMTCWLV